MSIVAMKKLRLIALRSEREQILRDLMLLGCVEVSEPTEKPEGPALGRDSDKLLQRRRAEQSEILQALRELDRYAPYKKGLLTPLPEVSLQKLLDEGALDGDLSLARRITALDGQVKNITAQESRERAVLEAMKPWTEMDLPLEKKGTATCDLMLGTVPAAVTAEAAEAALGELEADITSISEDKTARYIALVFRKECQEEVTNALRSVGFAPVSMTGFTGTPRENIARSEAELSRLAAEKEKLSAEICALAPRREELRLGADTLGTCIERGEAAEKLQNTESTFSFEGWITAPEEEKLGSVLEKYTCAWETEEPDKDHPEQVPIKLKNNKLTQPFNVVTEMYSLPSYKGLDPNPFIMPFFAFFFGMMFADMAYGLLLLIGGLLILKKARPRGTMKNLAGLLVECGISTFLLGLLTGGFFGDAVSQIGSWFGKSWSIVPHLGTLRLGGISLDFPLNLLSGNNPLYVLIFAVALGAVHLLIGTIIGCYLKIRDGEWIDAIFNDFSWWIILAGLGLMMLGKGKALLFVGLGMMVLGNVLTSKGLGKVTGLFGKIYNGATGYLGDFLSYSRLMALMLAGSVIASVFNQLGGLGNAKGPTVGGTILFILVFAIGHTLNFALNLIGCFVHTLRLQFLEFFGKWYRDGGRPFKPLSVKTKFVDIIKEE